MGTEFKNSVMNDFCLMKGIRREFSVARTPQQNGFAERRNRKLIEAARTMLADSKLPTTFWAKAVNTASYVRNRALVVKPYNKTPYDFFRGRTPALSFMRPFRCHVTILNTLYHLRKFDGKAYEGYFVGYSMNRIGPKWLFDIDTLTKSINYQLVVAGNQPNDNAGIKENLDASTNTNADVADAADVKENENDVYVSPSGSDKTKNKKHNDKAKRDDKGKSPVDSPTGVQDLRAEFEEFSFNSTNRVNAVSALVNAPGPNLTNSTNSFNTASPSINAISLNFRIARKSSFVDPSKYPNDPNMPKLEDIVYSDDEEDVGAEVDLSNLETNISVSPIPTTRVHKYHLVNQIIGDLNSAPQTRSMTRMVKEQGGLYQINDEYFHTFHVYMDDIIFGSTNKELCKSFERLMKGKFQMNSIGELTFFLGLQVKQKDDGIFISQDKYVAEILRKFGFRYVKSASTPIETKKPLLKDPDGFRLVVYVDGIIFSSTKKELCTEFERPMKDKFQMSSMGKITFFLGLQVKQKEDGIFISQDKYVVEVLRNFSFLDVKSAKSPVDMEKTLVKDADGDDLDLHLYRSMIGSLMYLTTSRPDIMYALTVNPTIYTSCIKLFWSTTKIKTVNGEAQIQALVDKKKGKDFFGKVTPLFETMMVQPQEDMGEESEIPNKHVTTTSNDPLTGEDILKLTELMELYTKLQSRVLALETSKANQALEIGSLKRKVKKLEKKASKKTHKLKRLYKIGSSTRVESSKDAGLCDQEDASKHESTAATTTGVEVSTAAITSQIYLDEITLAKALIDINTSKPKAKEIVIKEPSETPIPTSKDSSQQSSKDAKRQRIKEENESAELKRCLEIIPKDDDDVTIEATPISSKYPTIVDYKIYKEGRK
nr:putative ribonuclease H-like domain-containing protein [Tanacetum cinerariifolium]